VRDLHRVFFKRTLQGLQAYNYNVFTTASDLSTCSVGEM